MINETGNLIVSLKTILDSVRWHNACDLCDDCVSYLGSGRFVSYRSCTRHILGHQNNTLYFPKCPHRTRQVYLLDTS